MSSSASPHPTTNTPPLCVCVSHLLSPGSVSLPLIPVLFPSPFVLTHFLPFFFFSRSLFCHTCVIAGRADASHAPVWQSRLPILQNKKRPRRERVHPSDTFYVLPLQVSHCAANKIGFICAFRTFQRPPRAATAATVLAKIAAAISCPVGKRDAGAFCQLNEVAN